MNDQPKMNKVTSFWKHTTKNGKNILKSKTKEPISIPSGVYLMLFENTQKKTPKDPDYHLLMTQPETHEDIPF